MDRFFMDDFFNDPNIAVGLGALFGFFSIFLLAVAACTLVLYILRSIGLYRLAENRGMNNPGLAWIPFVGMFRAGAVADDIADRNGSKTYFRYFILGGYLLSWALQGVTSGITIGGLLSGMRHYRSGPMLGSFMMNNAISSLGGLFGMAIYVIIIIALNKVYKCYVPASSTSWTVLSVIFPFLPSIFLFSIRNRAPVENWYAPAPNYYPPAQPQNWQAPPPPNAGHQPAQPPPHAQQNGGYYPPQAPNPPEPWEVPDSKPEPPPAPPWNSNDNPPDGN